ncbi:hypothetical protein F6X53_19890 [Methylobacterium soli]|uniref:DUF1508 domain-containing protein n=1 Tax=Methylobacterium soli TaxID=553447 RepID=A0A6L3SYC4_9HYPH|nr:hypothetical protein F6X53_19890 [Methylobacterium soli]
MTNDAHPFTLEIGLAFRPVGYCTWEIRKHGQLIQRSDRSHRTAARAKADGLAAMERLVRDA